MTTRTKVVICSYSSTIMMLLIVFSKPLNIPDIFQYSLLATTIIMLALMSYLIKKQKKEQADGPSSSIETIQNKKKQLTLMITGGIVVGLSCPLWLPLTGSTLGVVGDFLVGLITVAIILIILVPKFRKLQGN